MNTHGSPWRCTFKTTHTLLPFTVAMTALMISTNRPASAAPIVDQQQPVIDTSAGTVMVIGGMSNQKLAQVVTAGISGPLMEVRLPVAGASGDLIVEIQGVAESTPNGVVLASEVIPAASLPPFFPSPPSFRSLVFSSPATFSTGDSFAVVLTSAGDFSVYPGPLGNLYPGGDGFFDARPNPPGVWVPLGDFGRSDMPFQTVVVPEASTLALLVALVLTLGWWQRRRKAA